MIGKNVSSFISIPCSFIYGVFSTRMLPSLRLLSKEQEESKKDMMSTKRVILADGSRLVRELLHHVIDKADHLQVVDEVANHQGLPMSIRRFEPDWVILPLPYGNPVHRWIDGCMRDHPAVRFVFLSPGQNNIKMTWQMSCEEEYSNLSLQEFIHILETDLRHT